MHSDQMRKDGISEPMIQALYYVFVANHLKTRMYSIRYDSPGDLIRPPSLNPMILVVQYHVLFSIVYLQ